MLKKIFILNIIACLFIFILSCSWNRNDKESKSANEFEKEKLTALEGVFAGFTKIEADLIDRDQLIGDRKWLPDIIYSKVGVVEEKIIDESTLNIINDNKFNFTLFENNNKRDVKISFSTDNYNWNNLFVFEFPHDKKSTFTIDPFNFIQFGFEHEVSPKLYKLTFEPANDENDFIFFVGQDQFKDVDATYVDGHGLLFRNLNAKKIMINNTSELNWQVAFSFRFPDTFFSHQNEISTKDEVNIDLVSNFSKTLNSREKLVLEIFPFMSAVQITFTANNKEFDFNVGDDLFGESIFACIKLIFDINQSPSTKAEIVDQNDSLTCLNSSGIQIYESYETWIDSFFN